MESKVKAMGHPIHQMLIPFPLGLLGTAVIFDIIYLIWHNPTMVTVSYWMIAAGIVGALAAAPFGFIDWLAIPSNTRAKTIGALHGNRQRDHVAAVCRQLVPAVHVTLFRTAHADDNRDGALVCRLRIVGRHLVGSVVNWSID
jgi:hypothetical protein